MNFFSKNKKMLFENLIIIFLFVESYGFQILRIKFNVLLTPMSRICNPGLQHTRSHPIKTTKTSKALSNSA